MAKYFSDFRDSHLRDDLTELEMRALDSFATCYAAGRLAIKFGIVPWEPAQLHRAIGVCWQASLRQIPNAHREAQELGRRICTWIMNEADIKVCQKHVSISDFAKHDGVQRVTASGAEIFLRKQKLDTLFGSDRNFYPALRWLKSKGVLLTERDDVYTRQAQVDDGSRPRLYCMKAEQIDDLLRNRNGAETRRRKI